MEFMDLGQPTKNHLSNNCMILHHDVESKLRFVQIAPSSINQTTARRLTRQPRVKIALNRVNASSQANESPGVKTLRSNERRIRSRPASKFVRYPVPII